MKVREEIAHAVQMHLALTPSFMDAVETYAAVDEDGDTMFLPAGEHEPAVVLIHRLEQLALPKVLVVTTSGPENIELRLIHCVPGRDAGDPQDEVREVSGGTTVRAWLDEMARNPGQRYRSSGAEFKSEIDSLQREFQAV